MVAKATAAMKPRKAEPHMASASSGAAMLPPLSKRLITLSPSVVMVPAASFTESSTAAPKPTMGMIT